MFKFTSLFLFTAYTLSSVRAELLGAAGQDCTPFDGDAPPEVCTMVNQKVTDREIIECKENYDCCLCGVINCKPECEAFRARGDYAAYKVPDIIIEGNTDDGAVIHCDGDSSCRGALIEGAYIKGIKCGGHLSCAGAEIDAECMVNNPCKLKCDGDESCQWSDFSISNVKGVICGDKACRDSDIVVTNPDDDFQLKCGGKKAEEACQKAEILIYVNGDITNKIKSIDCGGFKACHNAEISIINTGAGRVTIEEINCEADKSCLNTKFAVSGNVKVENCSCKEVNDYESCEGATFSGFVCK